MAIITMNTAVPTYFAFSNGGSFGPIEWLGGNKATIRNPVVKGSRMFGRGHVSYFIIFPGIDRTFLVLN